MATCLELSQQLTAAQNAVIAQQGVVRAKHAFSVAQMALYTAAVQDENKAMTDLQQLMQESMDIQTEMMMQNCPIQPGQA